jgi:dedicator of cytokinesis protein 3
MPGSQGPQMRSPTTSWLAASSPSLVTSPIAPPTNHSNGTQTSVVPEIKPSRHEKNRLSLTFLKRSSVSEPREGRKQTKPAVEEDVENQSNRASSHSGSKDTGKHRLSFLRQTSTNESAPAPSQPQNQSLVQTQIQSRSSQSIDRRPETSKSEQSSSHSFGNRVGSVRKRLSLLHIGRKASKNSVKGRLDETLAEE